MVRFITLDGQLEKKELSILGRKFPLLEILLSKYEKYMRLSSDAQIEEETLSDLRSFVARFDHKFAEGIVRAPNASSAHEL